jgi:hypothetical protein
MNQRCASIVFATALLAGCSASNGPKGVAARTGCEEATAQATATGRADAGLYAKAMLKYQIDDLKGYMIKDGYRSVAVKSQHVECRPYQLGLGMTQCIATARLCSR